MPKEVCHNCAGSGVVNVSEPCPSCIGNSLSEINELRKLANWVESNFKKRSRAPEDGIRILRNVRLSQGFDLRLYDHD
jgi:DnaJ-class molecular chaperone